MGYAAATSRQCGSIEATVVSAVSAAIDKAMPMIMERLFNTFAEGLTEMLAARLNSLIPFFTAHTVTVQGEAEHLDNEQNNRRQEDVTPQTLVSTQSPTPVGPSIEQATHEKVEDHKIAVIRRGRRFVTKANTWRLINDAAVNSKGSGAYLSDMTTTNKTYVLHKVISNDTMRTGAKVKRCEVVPADDVGHKGKTPKPKTPRLKFKEFQTVGPVGAWEVSATMRRRRFSEHEQ
ncbi:hypothetical protein HPB51_029448 [Rhipicephalus microplus]|uniref:Uncharacterized protein n=1 Tax=Rhipicephalus microplus TaxID=6941 RepID=A0A9J6CUF5_RHIMP|nr:hypothetical protein HPB51_029448 [Rhipicephalus microplus]